MESISKEQKQAILDAFGKIVIENVRDDALYISMRIATQETINPVKIKKYGILSSLSIEQQEAVCDLLSETITDTIYRFLEMFEENNDKMRLVLIDNMKEYNMVDISEKMGSEIACFDNCGWIQKFSSIGRFV